MSKRTEQVGDLIHRVLAEALLKDIADPRLKLISITAVEVSRDLSYATVFISSLGDDASILDAFKALEKAAGFLRRAVAKASDLRVVPQLRFKHDASTAYAAKMSELIDQARSRDSE